MYCIGIDIIFLKNLNGDIMNKYIEIDGVRYTESQVRRALALERKVLSPNFIPNLIKRNRSLQNFDFSKGGF